MDGRFDSGAGEFMGLTGTHGQARPAGFTLVEIIAVLVIIGVLAAVAAGRLGDDDHRRVVAAADKLKVHLRHAQIRAMFSDTSWGVESDGGGYWLFSGGDSTNTGVFPGEETATVSLPAGVSVGTFTISFDEWGRPHDGADPETGAEFTAAQTLEVANGHAVVITITDGTGFIP